MEQIPEQSTPVGTTAEKGLVYRSAERRNQKMLRQGCLLCTVCGNENFVGTRNAFFTTVTTRNALSHPTPTQQMVR